MLITKENIISNYYAFGSQMPGRAYTNVGYRYGFNGKENDNEVKGNGNQQDYGMRIYDSRLGKFLSIDPITTKYPELTPYQYASNNPIEFIDLDGLEGVRPLGPPIFLFTPDDIKNTLVGAISGLKKVAHDLAPIRPADENDPKDLTEVINNFKKIPENLRKIPSTLKEVFENGSTEEKAETTVWVLGTVLSLTKGKTTSPPVGILQAGFNVKTRILTFTQGILEKAKPIVVKVPEGFEPYKLEGSKSQVFKQSGKKVFISGDLDGHTGGIWKRAEGKAENLLKKETREGTYNADLSKKVGD